MPYMQILLICYASLSEPIAYFAIFPFINEMIARTGDIPSENVGFWAGAIESLFSLVQMLLMILYGRLADRLGRKPVLVFSLAGVSVATALFGLSTSLWQMIFFRCFAGVFAGTVVTIRTMISENCSKATQGRAFSWYMFTRNLGIFLGPLIGMIFFACLLAWRFVLMYLRWRSGKSSNPVSRGIWQCAVLQRLSIRTFHLRCWCYLSHRNPD